eukprot:m.8883 g.8883  ORF g.8883 m.8883 type:complete len:81 (-) comp5405_c0_seq2:490-732(-)
MYVEEWREFMDQSEALFKSDPDRCRFVVQYNDSGQSLIIKATNDKVCIMYRTSLLDDVKRLDKFSAKLMRSLLQPEGASA